MKHSLMTRARILQKQIYQSRISGSAVWSN